MKKLSNEEALYKASAYCSNAEHCISEVTEKLTAWGVAEDEQEHIITYLLNEHYIDENRYTRAYINDKFRFNKWGKNRIIQGLKQKKISPTIYKDLLITINKNSYQEELIQLISSKNKTVKAKTNYERKGKLIRYAIGKGYEMEEIIYCLSKLNLNEESLD